MKLAILLLLFSFHFSFAQTRLEQDQQAKQKFLNLHFSANGKGMMLVPDLIEMYEKMEKIPPLKKVMLERARSEWGFNVVNDEIVGIFNVPYKNMKLGVLGCIGCHSGKAAGVFIPGLGNKNIDILRIGQDVKWIESLYTKFKFKNRNDPDYKEAKNSAVEFAKLLANEPLANQSQGLVPVSFVRTWFYKQAGETWPENMSKGSVKVPVLWGYEEKRKLGQFCDGFGNGVLPGWAIAVELTAGQTVDTVREYLPKVEEAEHLFSYFLPVKYPFEIDLAKVQKGKGHFNQQCAGCHGQYRVDAQGLPLFEEPKWIPISVVGTDSDRLRANTPQFRDLVARNPLNDILQATNLGDGYFAPRLVGIWSRFPYLHNGSVPTIRDLLKEPAQRPQTFSLKEAGELHRFDKLNLGLTSVSSSKDRSQYSTNDIGHSSIGHRYGLSLSEDAKSELIEYLKTL
ncbi:MAG: hypothetical protein AB7F59_07170 [Bdellovibrionales bacterium]